MKIIVSALSVVTATVGLVVFLFTSQGLASDDEPWSLIAVSEDGQASVQLYDTPCLMIVPAKISAEIRTRLLSARIKLENRVLKGCWITHSPYIYIIDEEGDTGRLPMSIFEKPVEI